MKAPRTRTLGVGTAQPPPHRASGHPKVQGQGRAAPQEERTIANKGDKAPSLGPLRLREGG
eukprot:4263118-Pyramimonas_sp.AAC.1